MTESNTTDIPISFGIHFMIDGYNAPEEKLNNKESLLQLLTNLPAELEMHAISEPHVVEVGPLNQKDPGGVSGFILIAESHISFHTFPARGFVTIDVYTCKDELDTERVQDLFQSVFQYTDVETHVVKRGTRYPSKNIY